jgi:histidine phosphotransferase ChpT
MNATELASLLCSRLCHDLLSPVGALNNGIELLADETDPDMRERCLELLAESARASANKLKFFRLAFGAGGGFGAEIDTREAKAALEGLYGPEKRVELGWIVAGDRLPKGAVKLLLNLAMIAGDALVRGGRLDIGAESADRSLELVIRAEGPRILLDPKLRETIATGAERQAKEFELVGAGPRALGEQFKAAFAHFGVLLVGEQLDPVVERPHRREEIVAQAAAQQAGKIGRVHRQGDARGGRSAQDH